MYSKSVLTIEIEWQEGEISCYACPFGNVDENKQPCLRCITSNEREFPVIISSDIPNEP